MTSYVKASNITTGINNKPNPKIIFCDLEKIPKNPATAQTAHNNNDVKKPKLKFEFAITIDPSITSPTIPKIIIKIDVAISNLLFFTIFKNSLKIMKKVRRKIGYSLSDFI